MNSLVILLIVAVAVAFGIALAYVPMRLLVGTMAKNIRQFIQRQRDRRTAPRRSPDRRKAA